MRLVAFGGHWRRDQKVKGLKIWKKREEEEEEYNDRDIGEDDDEVVYKGEKGQLCDCDSSANEVVWRVNISFISCNPLGRRKAAASL